MTNKTIKVTDRFMIAALEESKVILEATGYRRSDKEIEDRANYFRCNSNFVKLLDAPNHIPNAHAEYSYGKSYDLEVRWVDENCISVRTDEADNVVYTIKEIEALYNFIKVAK